MRSRLSQRLSHVNPQPGKLDGKILQIADEHFKLSAKARRESQRKFWLFAKARSDRARAKARELEGAATQYWTELLRRYRPIVANCFKSGALPQDPEGGYASAMGNLGRQFEVVAQRRSGPPCFAEILWLAVCECVPGGKTALREYRERFHLLALLDEFDDVNQGTIRSGYFYQDGSNWEASNQDPNMDLKLAELYKAFYAYANFLCSLGIKLDRMTDGAISCEELRDGNAVEILMAWL